MKLKDIAKLPFSVRYIKTTDIHSQTYTINVNGTELIDLRLDNHIQHDEVMSDGALADYYYAQYPIDSWEPCSKYGHTVN